MQCIGTKLFLSLSACLSQALAQPLSVSVCLCLSLCLVVSLSLSLCLSLPSKPLNCSNSAAAGLKSTIQLRRNFSRTYLAKLVTRFALQPQTNTEIGRREKQKREKEKNNVLIVWVIRCCFCFLFCFSSSSSLLFFSLSPI